MKAKDLPVGSLCKAKLSYERSDIENFNTMTLKKTSPLCLFQIVDIGYAIGLNRENIKVGDMVCINPNEDVIETKEYIVLYGTIAEEVEVEHFFTLTEAINWCNKNTRGMTLFDGDRCNRNDHFWYTVTLHGEEVYTTNNYWK